MYILHARESHIIEIRNERRESGTLFARGCAFAFHDFHVVGTRVFFFFVNFLN